MKSNLITKLYKSLTAKEKAALAFQYLSNQDWLEGERVESSVRWKPYKCLDFEYTRWRDRFLHMGFYWSVEYWQLRTRHMAGLALFYSTLACRNKKEAREALTQIRHIESLALALDLALEATCSAHGLDVEAVRKLSGATPFISICSASPDKVYQAEMQEALSSRWRKD